METRKAIFSEAGQEVLVSLPTGQEAIGAAEGIVFDEFDLIAGQLGLPVKEHYAPSDQARLAIGARWGELHGAAWYIDLKAIV
jgi:hypothetical protein